MPAQNQPSERQKYCWPRLVIHTTAAARNAKWIAHLTSPFAHWFSESESVRLK